MTMPYECFNPTRPYEVVTGKREIRYRQNGREYRADGSDVRNARGEFPCGQPWGAPAGYATSPSPSGGP